jgi:hypothetical protein
MEQNPSWEADSNSASQGYTRLLWNPKNNFRVHKSLPLVSILSQMNPFHNFIPCLFNITVPSTPSSAKWSHFLDFLCIFLVRNTSPVDLIVHYWDLSWVSLMQYKRSYPIFIRSILIWNSQVKSSLQVFRFNFCIYFSSASWVLHAHPYHILDFI